ncbi:nitrite reductase small subunit NirD [Pseudonocardia sp. KRD291]|uniref:nitrite reductase small subunit NirD n=1 Tax=Pseudonocardia sp. KRD291 TaxID=2792007 RepID=UPI001C49DAB1|nr:nitrite reductase small subunit NirD [Pseudonocardia sp. KRD291]MBW0106093.1 nitrite reductase small subunit NirD [Pseudonocardia sp. KRD291]
MTTTRPLENALTPGSRRAGVADDAALEPRRSPESRPAARVGTEVSGWLHVCPLQRLQPGRGVAALVGDTQVAIFRMEDDVLYAVGNVDPYTGAAVISRGIVGDRGGVPTVASPVHKQAFRLDDGRCLDDPAVSLGVYRTRVCGADLQIGLR